MSTTTHFSFTKTGLLPDVPTLNSNLDAIDTAIAGRAQLVAAPSTATSAGVAGQIAFDATHIYVCVATNTWVSCGAGNVLMKFLSGDSKFDELQEQLHSLKSKTPQDAAAIAEIERQLAALRDERLAKSQSDLQQRIFNSLMRR